MLSYTVLIDDKDNEILFDRIYHIGESVYADFEAHFTISDPVLGILEYQHYYSINHDNQLHDLVIIKPLATGAQQQLLLTGLTI